MIHKYQYPSKLSVFLFFSFLVIFQSCHGKLIAYNHDKTIELSDVELNNWLEYRMELQYFSRKVQIEAYFLEKHILNDIKSLDSTQLKPINFNNTMYRNKLVQKYFAQDIKSSIVLDENEFNDLVEKTKKTNLEKKERRRLYQIFLKYPKNASAKVKDKYLNKIQSIKNQISDLQSFKKLAEKYSDSQSRINSGLIGNIQNGFFSSPLNEIIMSLKEKGISEVIKSKDGLMLLYFEKKVTPKIYTESEIHNNVKSKLLNYYFKVESKNKKQKIIDQLNIEIDYQKINNSDDDSIIAQSGKINLTSYQLKLLIDNKGTLENYNNVQIKTLIEDYFFGIHIYHSLSKADKTEVDESVKYYNDLSLKSLYLTEHINKIIQPPSLDKLLSFYNENIHLFKRQPTYSLTYISIKKSDNKTDIFDVYFQINNDSSKFDMFSQKYSRFENRFPSGKVVNFTSKNISFTFGVNFTKQLQLLNPGEISKPFKSDTGDYWMIRLDQKNKPTTKTFDEAKKQIVKKVGNRMVTELKNQIIKNILVQQDLIIIN
ncbi:MAG: peptidylprolyl isomerase [Marinicellaceae bacterium]